MKQSLIILAAVVLAAACSRAPREVSDEPPSLAGTTLRVVTSGGFAAAYDILAPEFARETGIELITEYGASSGGAPDSIPVRLERGEQFDVVVLSKPALDALTERGDVRAASRRDLADSAIGMAVRAGAPVPDIGTPQAFINTLLAAESIGYSASASGTYLSSDLFPRLGLWEQLEPKSRRVVSERVGAVVARGEVEIGFQQISEILPIEGITYVGRIPNEHQRITTFSAGITTRATNAAAAQRLIDYFVSPAAAATIVATGLEPAVSRSSPAAAAPAEASQNVAERLPSAMQTDEFPSRPVTFVVGFGVGGSADLMTRTMSGYIAAALGQPVQVINRRGAGTLIAANYVLEQPHDGYTVFASGFSPYLSNTILEGNAEYTIDDFAYLNFQWFDADLIALNKDSEYADLPALLAAIRERPKTVRASVVRGSGGHLIARLLLELAGIPQENLNLVAYNSGGPARAAVAGHVVDFIIISEGGTESIREYIRPLAIVSDERHPDWDVPTLTEAIAPTGIDMPILPGSIRGYATSAELKRRYPERFDKLARALQTALENEELQALLDNASIGRRWIGPERSERTMRETFGIFRDYAYLLNE